MNNLKFYLIAFLSLLLAGCPSVQTTKGGVVGVERKQRMISFISAKDIENQYARSYQETLSQAQKANKLDKSSPNAKRLDIIAQRLIAHVGIFRSDALKWDCQLRTRRQNHFLFRHY